MLDLPRLEQQVKQAVAEVKITDVHTHLFSPAFGPLLLWGFDELLNYHYLVAEAMRWSTIGYEQFGAMSKREKADLIWQKLFIENSPISEACRGVLTVLAKLGLDVSARHPKSYRDYFASLTGEQFVDRVFALANLDSIVMTNDPFDPDEWRIWERNFPEDKRFRAVLRLDGLLLHWYANYRKLQADGYQVSKALSAGTQQEVRRFLSDRVKQMKPIYMAVSLPPAFIYAEESAQGILIKKCILPVCREYNIPFAMMIGVKRGVNPRLRDAGNGMGQTDICIVEHLCATFPANKFLVTMLARENQHELAVAARKFRNLHIFGCWWFLNNPSLVAELTRMRVELLGLDFTPQHSDACVLDQLIYKWSHSRQTIADVLIVKYTDLACTGWQTTESEIKRDVANLFGGNFWDFVNR